MCYRSITKQLIWIRHLSDIILMRSKWGMRPRSRCCHRLHLTPKTSRLDRVAVRTHQRQWRETLHLCCERATAGECERASAVCGEAGKKAIYISNAEDVFRWMFMKHGCWDWANVRRYGIKELLRGNKTTTRCCSWKRRQLLLRIMTQLQLITCNWGLELLARTSVPCVDLKWAQCWQTGWQEGFA